MGGAVSSISGQKYEFIGGRTFTEGQIQLVAESWELIRNRGPDADRIGLVMFKNLFVHAPETFNMYESFRDLEDWEHSAPYKHHCKVVVRLISYLALHLRQPSVLMKNMDYMGKRHCTFPLTEVHFRILGNELISGLKDVLHEEFTPAMEKAWRDVFDILSAMLISYYKYYQKDWIEYNRRMEELTVSEDEESVGRPVDGSQ